ncbi:hypothetical protein M8J75_015025 [Diaphorina citri]|nr:hypothetical protein M8J75_015025 [Diaphorina citri]
MKILGLLILCCLGYIWCETVTIKQGKVRGTQFESRGGRKFHAFLGIPYAKAPEGELRFKNPEPHPGWEGEFDATSEGAMCVQEMTLVPRFHSIPMGEENCLFLNVHTPEKLPVLVWIYGGAFQMGDSGNMTYGPYYLMDRDVVYVNLNYRLGVLGFLSFETPSLSGNFGLKDQQLALQWVKDNIESFGGDSNSITIFGESAGAASVHYHLLSPKSRGLFHKAIMQSGSAFCPWALIPPGIAQDRAHAFATLLGCHGDVNDIVACLRQIPSDTILATQLKFMEWGVDPLISFGPVVEPPHDEAFISQHPYLLQTDPSIPLIIGYNRDEGAIRTSKLCADDMLEMNQLNARWDRYLPLTILLKHNVEQKDMQRVMESLREYYLAGRKVDKHNIRGMTDMFSDVLINHCVMQAAEHYSGPVYFYMYNYQAAISWASVFGNCSIPLGVAHADELINLFNLDSLFPDHQLEGSDLEASKTMVKLWTDFADKGVPISPNPYQEASFIWPPFDVRTGKAYLHIHQNGLAIEEQPFEERHKFVSSLPFKFHKLVKSKSNAKTEL